MSELFLVAQSLALFILAGLAEIGGGYLMWQWLHEGKGIWQGVLYPTGKLHNLTQTNVSRIIYMNSRSDVQILRF